MNRHSTSNPASTGGAGTFFEQNVGAYWLAQLLVRGIPPVFIETVVAEVHFQTEHLGWHTDDFLVICERPDATPRKLVGQVKRSFTVSSSDDDCRKTIQDFWKDFKEPRRFSPTADRLILVTLRGTNTLLEHFVGLLDCARAARDGAEFESRLATKGFISSKAVDYCGELLKIIAALEERAMTAADVWLFLRLLHVLSLDLHTSTRQTEAHIKSLLALTVKHGDSSGVAAATWNALLVSASAAMSQAGCLRRIDLPAELRDRHGSIGSTERQILRALSDHTAPVLRNIRSLVGLHFHLPRAGLVQKVLAELEISQVVLISGPAGSGKSAIGKAVVSLLAPDHFVFSFRVEEFAHPHIDVTLHAGQIPTNAQTLAAILAAQGRKVVLIESVERLLEKTTRDAFSDLMVLAAADRGMLIILTCRDYSIEQVRASFLRPVGISHTVVSVPPLEDTELAEIEAEFPGLAYPLKNPALRDILRNPYFLDKAFEIEWAAERPIPQSEREFRGLFWRQMIRAEHRAPAGVARHREEVFQEIAVRRARALSAYIICNDMDAAIVATLKQDSLIVSSEENPSLVATAHDVLEDWAILQWLGEQHLIHGGSFENLSTAIGAYPAIRRSYRRWVAELVDRDPGTADGLFRAAIVETKISAQFRDDTLVALLKAPSSSAFLMRHQAQLLANDKNILKRVIHLLRVACVTTPEWWPVGGSHSSIFHVPDGPAWATVLRLAHSSMDGFTLQELPLLLGLVEDAVRNVSWWTPELDGAEFVVGIGHWLLTRLDSYNSEELRKRVLKVIAKIPKADAHRFEALLLAPVKEQQQRDRITDELRELIFAGLEGMPAARDLPDLVLSVGEDYLLTPKDYPKRHRHARSFLDLESKFGINEGLQHSFFPASAARGPWIPLLRHHTSKALNFFANVFNHSVDWYIHPRVSDPLEPAWEIQLTFSDGTIRKQWGNPRLWNLYRGTSVGPYVLQSLLMALEKWLLAVASQHPALLDQILLDCLRRSDSAALSAVVASVATAYPHASGEALLVLLSAPSYIRLDRSRMVSEFQGSAMLGVLSQLQADNKIYEEERKEADGMPHRNQDLEAAIANLQLGPLASRVHSILDRHLAALPPKSEQDESDLMWRLAIHRMDLRQYTISDMGVLGKPNSVGKDGEVQTHSIRLEPKVLDPDMEAMVEESAARHSADNARLEVYMWGQKTFKRDEGQEPTRWKEKLDKCSIVDREIEDALNTHYGPGFVAAVCVRDHWDEMSDDQRNWCVDVVCSEISRKSNHWSHLERVQRFSMAADRPCARIVSLLLGKTLSGEQMLNVRQAFATAITHPVEEVRWYATWGVDTNFWASNRIVAMRCVNAIAAEAAFIDEAWETERNRPYDEQRQIEKIISTAATRVRERFWQEDEIAEERRCTLDFSGSFKAKASARILAILEQVPNEPATVAAFSLASRALVSWWDAARNKEQKSDRNFDTEAAISDRLQQMVMKTTSASAFEVLRPVLDVIDRHPREVRNIVSGLTSIEDTRPNTAQYWYLWSLFADGIRNARWVAGLNDEYPMGSEMLSAIFLTSWWKDNIRHWRSLEGYSHHIDALFEALPPSSIVLDDYVRFLYHIGERSLPDGFVRIANSIKHTEVQKMLAKTNTVFLLEILLQRYVYGRPLELKRDSTVRQAVLFLLDILVESGSSAAFRMRDDFVTPVA